MSSLLLVIAFYTAKIQIAMALDLVPLTTIDELFLLDHEKNRANILTVMRISKVRDPGELRQFLIGKITAF